MTPPDGDRQLTRPFLGRGWSFPVGIDDRSDIALSPEEMDIEESIRIILGTAKGERIMRPNFGCGIHEYAFSPINATTRHLIETSVREALIDWESRIEVQNIDVSSEEINTGKLLISIDYRVRSSNTESNLVYPFYLEE